LVQLQRVLELCAAWVDGHRIEVAEMRAAFVDLVGCLLAFEDCEETEPVAVARVEANTVR